MPNLIYLLCSPGGTLEALESTLMGPPKAVPPVGGWAKAPSNTDPLGLGITPAWAGRTPNPYAMGGSRTPGWTSGKTPNPYDDLGGKTPAWSANSRTPNPYAQKDSGKTPAGNASARTPNPYTSTSSTSDNLNAWGGATPGRPSADNSWGGATPAPASWGGATPGRPAGTDWGQPASASGGASGGFGGRDVWVRTLKCLRHAVH